MRAIANAEPGNTRGSPWDIVRLGAHPPNAIAAYLVGGAFVLPWYPAWALPTAALVRRSFLAGLVAAHAAFLVAMYEFELPAHTSLTGAGAIVRSALIVRVSWFALGAFVARSLDSPRRDASRFGFPLRP